MKYDKTGDLHGRPFCETSVCLKHQSPRIPPMGGWGGAAAWVQWEKRTQEPVMADYNRSTRELTLDSLPA
ncbi:MAG: hypothetical protein ACOY0R_16695, partial [Chloroflexota bacterium]